MDLPPSVHGGRGGDRQLPARVPSWRSRCSTTPARTARGRGTGGARAALACLRTGLEPAPGKLDEPASAAARRGASRCAPASRRACSTPCPRGRHHAARGDHRGEPLAPARLAALGARRCARGLRRRRLVRAPAPPPPPRRATRSARAARPGTRSSRRSTRTWSSAGPGRCHTSAAAERRGRSAALARRASRCPMPSAAPPASRASSRRALGPAASPDAAAGG